MAGRSARGRRGAELWQIGVSFQRIASMSLEKHRACELAGRASNAAKRTAKLCVENSFEKGQSRKW